MRNLYGSIAYVGNSFSKFSDTALRFLTHPEIQKRKAMGFL